MQFLQPLRDRIRRGEITTTVRLWQRPHVKVGHRYALPPGGPARLSCGALVKYG